MISKKALPSLSLRVLIRKGIFSESGSVYSSPPMTGQPLPRSISMPQPYWPAVLLCQQASDLPDTLDYESMAEVARGLAQALSECSFSENP